MAILFELAVNSGTDNEAARAAAELVRRVDHVDVHGVPVPFGEPFVRELTGLSPAYIEFAVHPRGIGFGSPARSRTSIHAH